jgi:glycosyltransferase involved in cell wall biosynthesis
MVPKKGFETLLRACAQLKGRREVACELVGDGPSKGRLERLSRKLGLGSTVLFRRWLAYESMPEAYACADVLVVPSVEADDGDRDGLPNVVAEAMASGTPVVASDISGIPEVVRDGQTGLLCPPGDAKALSDAVARVLGDAALRRRIVANARALAAERLDCRKNTRRIYELLRQAAGCT